MASKKRKPSQTDVLIEIRDGLREEMRGLRAEIGEQIGGLRAEMGEQIGGLRGEVGGLRGEVGGLRGEVRLMRQEVRDSQVRTEARFESLEGAVNAGFQQLGDGFRQGIGGVNARLDGIRDIAGGGHRNHEVRITVIETKLGIKPDDDDDDESDD